MVILVDLGCDVFVLEVVCFFLFLVIFCLLFDVFDWVVFFFILFVGIEVFLLILRVVSLEVLVLIVVVDRVFIFCWRVVIVVL